MDRNEKRVPSGARPTQRNEGRAINPAATNANEPPGESRPKGANFGVKAGGLIVLGLILAPFRVINRVTVGILQRFAAILGLALTCFICFLFYRDLTRPLIIIESIDEPITARTARNNLTAFRTDPSLEPATASTLVDPATQTIAQRIDQITTRSVENFVRRGGIREAMSKMQQDALERNDTVWKARPLSSSSLGLRDIAPFTTTPKYDIISRDEMPGIDTAWINYDDLLDFLQQKITPKNSRRIVVSYIPEFCKSVERQSFGISTMIKGSGQSDASCANLSDVDRTIVESRLRSPIRVQMMIYGNNKELKSITGYDYSNIFYDLPKSRNALQIDLKKTVNQNAIANAIDICRSLEVAGRRLYADKKCNDINTKLIQILRDDLSVALDQAIERVARDRSTLKVAGGVWAAIDPIIASLGDGGDPITESKQSATDLAPTIITQGSPEPLDRSRRIGAIAFAYTKTLDGLAYMWREAAASRDLDLLETRIRPEDAESRDELFASFITMIVEHSRLALEDANRANSNRNEALLQANLIAGLAYQAIGDWATACTSASTALRDLKKQESKTEALPKARPPATPSVSSGDAAETRSEEKSVPDYTYCFGLKGDSPAIAAVRMNLHRHFACDKNKCGFEQKQPHKYISDSAYFQARMYLDSAARKPAEFPLAHLLSARLRLFDSRPLEWEQAKELADGLGSSLHTERYAPQDSILRAILYSLLPIDFSPIKVFEKDDKNIAEISPQAKSKCSNNSVSFTKHENDRPIEVAISTVGAAMRSSPDDAGVYDFAGDLYFCKGLADSDRASYLEAFRMYQRAEVWRRHASDDWAGSFSDDAEIAAREFAASRQSGSPKNTATTRDKAIAAAKSAGEFSIVSAAASLRAGDVVGACGELAYARALGAAGDADGFADRWSSRLGCGGGTKVASDEAVAPLGGALFDEFTAKPRFLPRRTLDSAFAGASPPQP